MGLFLYLEMDFVQNICNFGFVLLTQHDTLTIMRRLNEEYFWFGFWHFQMPNVIGLMVELLGEKIL